MIVGALLWVGVILTVSWYGWFHLLAFFPIWYFFGAFWWMPPLVGMMRVAKVFTPIEFCFTAVFQILWVVLLWYLLAFLGMSQLYSYYMIVGIVTGLSMNANDLRLERLEFSRNRKPYFWETKK